MAFLTQRSPPKKSRSVHTGKALLGRRLQMTLVSANVRYSSPVHQRPDRDSRIWAISSSWLISAFVLLVKPKSEAVLKALSPSFPIRKYWNVSPFPRLTQGENTHLAWQLRPAAHSCTHFQQQKIQTHSFEARTDALSLRLARSHRERGMKNTSPCI